MSGSGDDFLRVDDLTITLETRRGSGRVVEGVSFAVDRSSPLGLVGESGSGKSLTALSIMRLLPPVAQASGRIFVGGRDVLPLPEREVRAVRGAQVGMIFQQARSALSPLMRIGRQITRVAELHGRLGRKDDRRAFVAEILREVGLPGRVARSYPHQLSGGMAQRALIAIVLAGRPAFVIADEPTTGLDVTTEAEVYDLLAALRAEFGLGLLLITHDLALVSQNCDRVAVMHGGHLVELGTVEAVFDRPLHPYTRALLDSVPVLDGAVEDPASALAGRAPTLAELPERGCRFIARCPLRMPQCAESVAYVDVEPGHRVLCRLYG